jgi:hypothetical protein
LDWSLCLLLDDHSAISNATTGHEVTDANFDEIAAAKFAVDRKVKQRPISQPMLAIEHEADLPNLLWL